MTDANAERDAQIIAWLTKKAREYDTAPGHDNRIAAGVALTLASKIRRGAVRANNLLTLPASADPAPEWQDADDVELARLRERVAELAALRRRIRVLHYSVDSSPTSDGSCIADGADWPCDTVRALAETPLPQT